MRLTIIPSDKAVYVNQIAKINLNWEGTPPNINALQWYEVEGWLEFEDNTPNEKISSLPEWASNAYNAWAAPSPPPPPPTAEQNKNTATYLLSITDWTALPDVADPLKSNPYLANANEFNTYRNAVRQYAITPVAGEINWPTMPTEDWQSA